MSKAPVCIGLWLALAAGMTASAETRKVVAGGLFDRVANTTKVP